MVGNAELVEATVRFDVGVLRTDETPEASWQPTFWIVTFKLAHSPGLRMPLPLPLLSSTAAAAKASCGTPSMQKSLLVGTPLAAGTDAGEPAGPPRGGERSGAMEAPAD